MASGKDAARDVRHGRRGGNWIPDGRDMRKDRFDRAPKCGICKQPMLLGQRTSHAACASMLVAFPEHTRALAKEHEIDPTTI